MKRLHILIHWYKENHFLVNINPKTVELVLDFRRQDREHTLIMTDVEWVNSFNFLIVHITEDLIWSTHPEAVVNKIRL